MRTEKYTFEVEYRMFDVGEQVTPTSPRSPLEMGKVYTVTRCVAPFRPLDDSVVFVEGRETGVSADYLTTV